MTPAPPDLHFEVTDNDVAALRALRPRRSRMLVLECAWHLLIGMLATPAAVPFVVGGGRSERLENYLTVLAVVWALGWIYLAFLLFRPSRKTHLWFERLRNSPVLAKGSCTASLRDDVLTLVTPTVTRTYATADLADHVFDENALFIRTGRGDAIIIPRRALATHDRFANFCCNLKPGRDDAGEATG